MKPTKPKQIRKKKYICEYCDNVFYEHSHNVNELDLICDVCRLDREEEDDDILKLIRQVILEKSPDKDTNGQYQRRD